jgi:hypothetical protein
LKCGSLDTTLVAIPVSSCHSTSAFHLRQKRKPLLFKRPRSGSIDKGADDPPLALEGGR